jgi:rare lipoprotein A
VQSRVPRDSSHSQRTLTTTTVAARYRPSTPRREPLAEGLFLTLAFRWPLVRDDDAEHSALLKVSGLGGTRNCEIMTRLVRVCVSMSVLCFVSTSAFAEICVASHYGYSGGRTASGERMNPSAMTAAHRTKSFGSQVTVTSQKSGRSVTVRINDRGPFIKGRCIDLSTGAARALGMAGIERVSLN